MSAEKFGELSSDANGTKMQIMPLMKDCQGESAGGIIDTTGMRAIMILSDCNAAVDGGLQIPLKAGSVWGVEGCDRLVVDAATKYVWF